MSHAAMTAAPGGAPPAADAPSPARGARASVAPAWVSGGHLRLVRDAATPAGVASVAPSAEALIEEAQAAERQGRRAEARALYERALPLLRGAARTSTVSAVLRWVAATYRVDADYDAALDCAEAALAVAELCGDESAAGHAVNLQATVHWAAARLDQAEPLFIEALKRGRRSGDARLAGMAAQNVGVLANIRGDLEAALRHYEAALLHYRTLGLTRDVCLTLNNVGMLYTDMQRYADAAAAYREAIQITEVLGDFSTRMPIDVNLAELHIAQGAYEEAREACDRAMQVSATIGDTRSHGEAYKIYGIVARETGDFPAAEQHFARAEQIAGERQDLLLVAEVLRDRADLHRRQGRNRDTLQCLNRSHRLFSQLRAQRDLAEVDRRTTRLEGDFLEVVRKWGDSIESKDEYTQGHCERVADLACAIAAKTGMDAKSLFWFRIGALLHDVGKLLIPPEVLNKPGRLNEEEWALMRKHPSAGVEMLSDIEFPWDVQPIVEYHHERWDGGGYPSGLAGEQIPLDARILCLADVYDALTSKRSYKKALSHDAALEIMRRDIGKQFDPGIFGFFEEALVENPALRGEESSE